MSEFLKKTKKCCAKIFRSITFNVTANSNNNNNNNNNNNSNHHCNTTVLDDKTYPSSPSNQEYLPYENDDCSNGNIRAVPLKRNLLISKLGRKRNSENRIEKFNSSPYKDLYTDEKSNEEENIGTDTIGNRTEMLTIPSRLFDRKGLSSYERVTDSTRNTDEDGMEISELQKKSPNKGEDDKNKFKFNFGRQCSLRTSKTPSNSVCNKLNILGKTKNSNFSSLPISTSDFSVHKSKDEHLKENSGTSNRKNNGNSFLRCKKITSSLKFPTHHSNNNEELPEKSETTMRKEDNFNSNSCSRVRLFPFPKKESNRNQNACPTTVEKNISPYKSYSNGDIYGNCNGGNINNSKNSSVTTSFIVTQNFKETVNVAVLNFRNTLSPRIQNYTTAYSNFENDRNEVSNRESKRSFVNFEILQEEDMPSSLPSNVNKFEKFDYKTNDNQNGNTQNKSNNKFNKNFSEDNLNEINLDDLAKMIFEKVKYDKNKKYYQRSPSNSVTNSPVISPKVPYKDTLISFEIQEPSTNYFNPTYNLSDNIINLDNNNTINNSVNINNTNTKNNIHRIFRDDNFNNNNNRNNYGYYWQDSSLLKLSSSPSISEKLVLNKRLYLLKNDELFSDKNSPKSSSTTLETLIDDELLFDNSF